MLKEIVSKAINAINCSIDGHSYIASPHSLRNGSIGVCKSCGHQTTLYTITKKANYAKRN